MVRIVLPKVYFSCSVGRSLEQIEENESRGQAGKFTLASSSDSWSRVISRGDGNSQWFKKIRREN